MIKEPSWRAKLMYIMFACALVFGLAATVVTAVPEPAKAQTTPPFRLVPDLSMNVKTASETFTVVDNNGYPVPGDFVSNWQVVEGEGTGEVHIVAGGQDGNNSITVRMVVIGDTIITCNVDNGAGYTDFLIAEKKWGEITRTVLESPQVDNVEVGETRTVTERVFADFLPGPVEAPAGGAKINWWLFENDDADLAQSALEDLIERFGPDNYSYVSGPMGYGQGCGQYSWWGYGGDGTFIPADLLSGLYASYGAQYTAFTAAEGGAIAPTTNYVTYTDNVNEPLGNGLTNMGVTFSDTGNGEAEPVILVVLADYPLDKNGENAVCIEYIKFTPQRVVEFNPDFEGVPRACEEVEGCCVEFVNLTEGGILPYHRAVWDFGDGWLPVHGAINPGDTIEHCYTEAGDYMVHLSMWDAVGTEAFQAESDYITVGGEPSSLAEFDPDFEGAPRVCEEIEGCIVEFTNLTDGGVLPYSDAIWDFGDGSLPAHGAINAGDTITHQYTSDGLYTTTLSIWDANSTEAYQVALDYILVGEGGTGSTATWSFDVSGYWPKHLPDAYWGEVVLDDLDTGTIPACVHTVYWYDCDVMEWKFWAPGAPGCTLSTLGGGYLFNYLVGVLGPCDWVIPLTDEIPKPMQPLSVPYNWNFCSPGFFPQHLPDTFFNSVQLSPLVPTSIPPEVQGVWWFDEAIDKWLFWVPGVGGELTTLVGGLYADYMVLASGPCEWAIPLIP